jgi:hypothetical protein
MSIPEVTVTRLRTVKLLLPTFSPEWFRKESKAFNEPKVPILLKPPTRMLYMERMIIVHGEEYISP